MLCSILFEQHLFSSSSKQIQYVNYQVLIRAKRRNLDDFEACAK